MTQPSAPSKPSAPSIGLALLSHTNVGKTTLARTLLRQDVGAVLDRPHVTEVAEAHVLVRAPSGEELVLWDTPGFGDSVRLLRRLERSHQPLGWFLSQVWDRLADRPFWCSQQALRAARESADVLLYVANATEDPGFAGYVAPELRILQWLGKPTLLLLNQLGTRGDTGEEALLRQRWEQVAREHVPGLVVGTMPFDAFARCWIQEHTLLEAIGAALPAECRQAFARLQVAWSARDATVLHDSARAIARQLERLARDVERAPEASLLEQVKQFVRVRGGTEAANAAEARAQQAMLERLDAAVRDCTTELVALHGLAGGADETILAQLGRSFTTERAPDADRVGLLGGLVSGAFSGLAADLATGGLTLGAGALLGGIAGAFGARSLTQRYNAARGLSGSTLRWSREFLDERLQAAVVRYLAVAHYGRGRGEFRQGEPDPRWLEAAQQAVDDREKFTALFEQWGEPDAALLETATGHVEELLRRALAVLYPQASAAFERSRRAGAR